MCTSELRRTSNSIAYVVHLIRDRSLLLDGRRYQILQQIDVIAQFDPQAPNIAQSDALCVGQPSMPFVVM